MMTYPSALPDADDKDERCIWQEFSVPYRFPVRFTSKAFSLSNPALVDILGLTGSRTTIFAVADAGVTDADPFLAERIDRLARLHHTTMTLIAPLHVIPGGERCKAGPGEVEKLHHLFLKHRLCRHSVILAIGGGAFLDVVGYAAATAHRGIRLIRMPTTTLAQCDAGIGVKNGFNAYGRKNWVGTFSPPLAVVNDFEFLLTLPPRHSRAGLAEAVKVGIIKDARFFRFLHAQRKELALLTLDVMKTAIIRCAEIHLQHIAGGDPFETGSARPLDFGHWIAHALEDLSHGELVHGEAVAIGMALDCRYARRKGVLAPAAEGEIVGLLRDLGFTLSHPLLEKIHLNDALDQFRQHLGGRLTITLPTGLGHSIEVNDLDLSLLHHCREQLSVLHEDENYGEGAAVGCGITGA